MDKLIDVFDKLKDWDLIKFNKGVVGLFFDNSIHSNKHMNMEDEIEEIKHVNLDELWDFIPSTSYSIFIGVSYEANPNDINEVKDWYLEDENADISFIEYDPFSPLEVNNKKLVEANDHVIIPPASFEKNHIIGKGLLSQIQERKKAGKISEIYVDYEVYPIKDVYELKGNDNTKAAVVVF